MPPRLRCNLPGLLVTGTDTGIGKTWVSARITRALVKSGHKVAAIKPVATGYNPDQTSADPTDGEILARELGHDVPMQWVNPIRFRAPLAPPVAARQEGFTLTIGFILEKLQQSLDHWASTAEIVIIEGVGGFLCPLSEHKTVADLAIELDFPLIIVARRGLGTLNHTLLTVEAAHRRGLRIAGIVLNGSTPTEDLLAEETNTIELSQWLEKVPILAEIPHEPSHPDAEFFERIDWASLARRSRLAPGT